MELKTLVTPIKKPMHKCDLILNFKKGDLLFGLHEEGRARFLDVLGTLIRPEADQKGYFTVDDINASLGSVIYNPDFQDVESDDQQYDSLVQAHLAAWKRYKKYFPATIKGDEETRERKALIGSCKVALLTYPGNIHFCLDGIIDQGIRNKNSEHGRKYTSSELRLCAKNWSKIEHRVKFYYDGEDCDPPWKNTDPIEWMKQTSEISEHSVTVTPAESSFGESDWDESPRGESIVAPLRRLAFSSEMKRGVREKTDDFSGQEATPVVRDRQPREKSEAQLISLLRNDLFIPEEDFGEDEIEENPAYTNQQNDGN